MAKWLSVRLRTKWLWVRIPLLPLKLQIWRLLRARSSLTLRQTLDCGFTLKLVRDMIIRYSHNSSGCFPWSLMFSRESTQETIGFSLPVILITQLSGNPDSQKRKKAIDSGLFNHVL